MKRVLILMLTALSTHVAAAASQEAVLYSGTLMDGDEPGADGVYQLEYQLFTQPSGGSPVATMPAHDVTVTDGRFSDDIGALFSTPVSDAYLQVSVHPPGGGAPDILGRVRVTAVPYAVRATTAEYAERVDWSGVVNAPAPEPGEPGESVVAESIPPGTGPCTHGGSRFTVGSGAPVYACHGNPGFTAPVDVSNAQPGQVLKYDGTTWRPGDDVDSRPVAGAGLQEQDNAFSVAPSGIARGMLAPDAVDSSLVEDGTLALQDLDVASVDTRYFLNSGGTLSGDLTIRRNVASPGATTLRVQNDRGGDSRARIDLLTYQTGWDPSARIEAVDSNYSADLVFMTKAPGAELNRLTERLRIQHDGPIRASATLSSTTNDTTAIRGEVSDPPAGQDVAGVEGHGPFSYGVKASGGWANLYLVPTSYPPGSVPSGNHRAGELLVTSDGSLWYCHTGGFPGSWVRVAGP